jgi:cytosine/adenosine deaminase-related metal-dependent hydrolase
MLIINATLVTWEAPSRILENYAVLIQAGLIVEIGASEELLRKHPLEDRLDAHSQYVFPGNICAHTHFYGAFSRGMSIPGSAPADFPEKLKKLWWPLDRALTVFCVGLPGGSSAAWHNHII